VDRGVVPGRKGGDACHVGDVTRGDSSAAIRQAVVAGEVADHRGDLVPAPARLGDGLPSSTAAGPENHDLAHLRNTSW
jgi:hypothetical protein